MGRHCRTGGADQRLVAPPSTVEACNELAVVRSVFAQHESLECGLALVPVDRCRLTDQGSYVGTVCIDHFGTDVLEPLEMAPGGRRSAPDI